MRNLSCTTDHIGSQMEYEEDLQDVERAFKRLTHNERTVIIDRFGLADGFTYTLKEVGEKLNLSRERIRQIELKALRKLQDITKNERTSLKIVRMCKAALAKRKDTADA